MSVSTAAKVGATTLASVIAIAVGMSWLTSFSLRKTGYNFDVAFADVNGLLKGGNVYYMGVKVGKVTTLAPTQHLVEVKVHVDQTDVKLPANGRFKIMSMGIIGEKALEIFPPKEPKEQKGKPKPTPVPLVWLKEGDRVRGDDPARLELVMDELSETFEDLRKSTDPAKFQDLFNKTADNLYQTTETVKRIGKQAEQVMGGLKPVPAQIVEFMAGLNKLENDASRLVNAISPADAKAIARDMRHLSAGLLSSYNGFLGPAQAQNNLKAAANLRNAIANIDNLTRNLADTTGDPGIQKDLRDTIHNIRELTGRVGGVAGLAETAANPLGLSIEPSIQAVGLNSPAGTGLAANLGVKLNIGANWVNAGIEQVGEGNFFNLSLGDDRIWGRAGYHFGLVRSKIGAGVGYEFNDRVAFLAQLYDPFRPTMRIGANYFPIANSQYGLLAQAARTFQTGENFIWVGAEWRPIATQPTPVPLGNAK